MPLVDIEKLNGSGVVGFLGNKLIFIKEYEHTVYTVSIVGGTVERPSEDDARELMKKLREKEDNA